MESVADLLQAWLVTPSRNQERLDELLRLVDASDRLVVAQVRLARRFAGVWAGFEAGSGSALDLAVLVRQIVRSFNRRFWIPEPLWRAIAHLDARAGLQVTETGAALVEVTAGPWQTNWLTGTEEIDALLTRRTYKSAPGSGALFKAYGHVTYQSEAQKTAVEMCQFAPPGATTLVTLPTGGGKSLCTVLPTWIRSHAGTKRGGATIVILPTVALALDQETAAQRLFGEARGPEYRPRCWSGSTSEEERASIQEALENGIIPLLFTSPESLMLSELRRAVTTAATRGYLAEVVIDEAHIVESWGAQFRAEFQLMGAFLQELSIASRHQLRVTLLSATADQRSENLLRQLFAYGAFTIVRANAVRPEPSWWFDWGTDVFDRRRKIVEALYYLPRPAILYVTRPDDASDWVDQLRERGYRRVDAFTGRTPEALKPSILKRWREDEIDVMVATSAFGLGVDKPDVRTVIHACLPETIDRFYQEVGRGGRDGNSCVSLICAIEEDLDTAIDLTSASIITTDKAVNRWLGMRRTAHIGERADLISIDVNAPPIHDLDMGQGPRNREWNMHTLLLLQRANLLQITNSALPQETDEEAADRQDRGSRIALRPLDLDALQGTATRLTAILEPERADERARVWRNAHGMKQLVVDYAGRKVKPAECIAWRIARLYPGCALACGGCPACRSLRRQPYAEPLEFFIERSGPDNCLPAPLLDGEFAASIGTRARLTIFKPVQVSRLIELVAALVGVGVIQIIAPSDWLEYGTSQGELVHALAEHPFAPHLIVPAGWMRTRQDIYPRNVPTVVLYHGPETAVDTLYRDLRARRSRIPASTPVISLIDEGTYLPSESGRFVDRVPGIKASGEVVLRQLRTPSEEWF